MGRGTDAPVCNDARAHSLVGALAISLLIYILPFLSHLRLFCPGLVGKSDSGGQPSALLGFHKFASVPSPRRLALWDVVVSVVVVAFGVFTLVVGVGQSAANLFAA